MRDERNQSEAGGEIRERVEDCVDDEKKNKRDGYEGDSGGRLDTDTRVGR